MGLDLLLSFNQEDCRKDKEPAGYRGKADIAEEVPEKDEQRYQGEAKPSCPAPGFFADSHGLAPGKSPHSKMASLPVQGCSSRHFT
jgi:hypothetical protein